MVGDFKNAGRQWRPKGEPAPVRVHDFLIPARGKAIPYGVYDLTRNAGWVGVGIDHDTAKVAVSWSIGLAAFSRTDVGEEQRPNYQVFIDEFQSFTTLSVANMVSELRKFHIALVLAHQHLYQLEPEVRHAVLGNVATLLS